MLLFWPRTTKQGIIAAVTVGMLASLAWILLSADTFEKVYGWSRGASIVPAPRLLLLRLLRVLDRLPGARAEDLVRELLAERRGEPAMLGLVQRDAQGLLDQEVHALLEQRHRQGGVVVGRDDDADGVAGGRHLVEGGEAPAIMPRADLGGALVVERGHDDQDAIGADRARFPDLVRVDHEILAQHRQSDLTSHRIEIS